MLFPEGPSKSLYAMKMPFHVPLLLKEAGIFEHSPGILFGSFRDKGIDQDKTILP